MPKVGKKKFPYTKEGIKAAKKYSKKTGEPIIYANEYSKGGTPKYASGGGVEYYESKSGAGTGGVPDLHQATPLDFGPKGGASPEEELLAPEEEPTSTVDSEACPEGQHQDEDGYCVDDEVSDDEEENGDEPESEPEPGDDPTKVKIHDEDPNVIKSQQAQDTGVGVTMKAEDPTVVKSQQARDTGTGVTMESKVKDADFGIDKGKLDKIDYNTGKPSVLTSKPEIKLPKLAGDNKPGSFIKPSSGGGGGGLKLNLKDKISSGGGGGGSNPLEAIKDKVEETTAKKGAIVNRKSKKGKDFKTTFKEAREAGKKEFIWNGKKYNTRTKEETPSLDNDAYIVSQMEPKDWLFNTSALYGGHHSGDEAKSCPECRQDAIDRKRKMLKRDIKNKKSGIKKYHKGGRATPKKKGLAIIIAIGKPRVNRKSKKR